MLDINSLPAELYRRIAELVRRADLKALRLVNKQFAAVAAWPLFKTLHFSGPASLPIHDDTPQRNNVEYGRLHETIEAALPLARYAKTFHFNPAYYHEGFLQGYRAYIESQVGEPVDEVDLDYDREYSDVIDYCEEYESAMERIQEKRNSRPAREASLIEEGERFFRRKMEEQDSNAGRISSALKSLFEAMPALEKVEIEPWEIRNFKGLKFECLDRDIERRDPSSIAVVTESLAESMQSAGQHAKSLHLVGLDPESLFVTSATRYLFAGLKHLKLDIWYIEFMLESAPVSSTFANLFECCQRTLQTLEIMGGEWPKLPSEDEHYLIKIFSEEQDVKAPVFPELRVLGLLGRGYPVLNTTSLISFIACQPQLQSLSFNNIYLASSNIRWPAVVSSFPDSVRHWRACGRFGNEPSQEFMPPVAYNWIKGAQEECGWKPHPTSDYRWIDFYR